MVVKSVFLTRLIHCSLQGWKSEHGFNHMDNIASIEFAHNVIVVRKGTEADEWFERFWRFGRFEGFAK